MLLMIAMGYYLVLTVILVSDMSFTGDTVIQYGASTVMVSTTSGKKSPSPDHTQVRHDTLEPP